MANDLFQFFEFEKITVFSLPAEAWLTIKFELKEGAIHLNIKANDTNWGYDLQSNYEGIELLLEAVTDLLPVVGDYDKYFNQLRTYSRCIHNDSDGGDIYQWDFKRINDSMILVIVRQNSDTDYEEQLRLHNFDIDDDFNTTDKARLQNKLLAAFSMPLNHFTCKLKLACDDLLQQIPVSECAPQPGKTFPEKLYHKLKTYCNYYPYGFP